MSFLALAAASEASSVCAGVCSHHATDPMGLSAAVCVKHEEQLFGFIHAKAKQRQLGKHSRLPAALRCS